MPRMALNDRGCVIDSAIQLPTKDCYCRENHGAAEYFLLRRADRTMHHRAVVAGFRLDH